MRTVRPALAFVILSLFFVSCRSNQKNPIDSSHYFIFEDSTLALTAPQAWKLFKSGGFREVTSNSFNPGFTSSYFWLVVHTARSSSSGLYEVEIGTSQINQIDFFEINNDTPKLAFVTGDRFPYAQRPEPTLNYNFDVAGDHHYLMKIDKRNESLQITFMTWLKTDFEDQALNSSLLIGIFCGVIILMAVFGLYLFIISREAVYLFYVLYIVSGWIYVLANLGYGYKYLWPDSPFMAMRARPLTALATIALSLLFIEHYTGRVPYKWLHRSIRGIAYASALILLVAFIPGLETSSPLIYYYWQAAIPLLSALYLVALLGTLIWQVVQGNKMALFYLASILPIAFFNALQLLYYSGAATITGSFWKNYGTATGYVLEAMILTFGLVYRFNSYRLEKEQLLVRVNQQQLKYTKAIISTQETERRQLADQLHDVAGSLLSAAKLNLSSIREKSLITNQEAQAKLTTAENAVTDISQMLRDLSHAISPVMLDKIGFRQSVEKIASLFNASEKIKVELEILGFESDQPSMHEKYSVLYGILYELINNTAKHAQATHALVQLIEHDDSVVLIVEDNGKGLNISEIEKSETHGLAAIKSKIHYLEGQITFDHAVPHGLIITIEIPKEQ